jgi:hypothetical protein
MADFEYFFGLWMCLATNVGKLVGRLVIVQAALSSPDTQHDRLFPPHA